MKIIFWGTPKYSVGILEDLINSNHEVLAVITQPDKKRSRGSRLTPSPIKELSESKNIKVFCPEKIKDNNELINNLKAFNCDLFIVVAYGKILSKEILEIPKYGSWNAHASLLPRWRGAAPIQWAILSGDKYTGVGIMKMEEGLDTGDIILEERTKIENDDNFNTLSNKLSRLSSKLIINTLDLLSQLPSSKAPITIPQIELNRETTYARMIIKSDFLVNFNDNSTNVTRKIRALYPLAYIKYKNKNLKILEVEEFDINKQDEINFKQFQQKKDYGIILGIIKNKGIIVSTQTEPLIILKIKLEGKNISTKNQLIQQLNPIIGEKL